MSKLLAVAARELRERWLLFPGALVAGLVPLVLPAFGVRRELAPTAGAVGAALFGVAAAVVIGSSMLARDSVERPAGLPLLAPAAPGHRSGAASGWPHSSSWRRAASWSRSPGWWPTPPTPPRRLLARGDGRRRGDGRSSGRCCLLGIGFANFNGDGVPLALGLAGRGLRPAAPRRVGGPPLRGPPPVPGHPRRRLTAGGVRSALAPVAIALLLGERGPGRRRPDRPAPRAPSRCRSRFWAVIAAGLLAAALVLHWALAARPADLRGPGSRRASDRPLGLVEGSSGSRRARAARGPDRHRHPGRSCSPGRRTSPARGRRAGHSPSRATGGRAVRWRAGWSDQARDRRAVGPAGPADPRDPGRASSRRLPLTLAHARSTCRRAGRWLLLVHESGASLFAADGRRVATATLPPNMPGRGGAIPGRGPGAGLAGAGPLVAETRGCGRDRGDASGATTPRRRAASRSRRGPERADASARTLLAPADEGRSVLSTRRRPAAFATGPRGPCRRRSTRTTRRAGYSASPTAGSSS